MPHVRFGSEAEKLMMSTSRPLFPQERTFSDVFWTSA
jgi:hypothetical protein